MMFVDTIIILVLLAPLLRVRACCALPWDCLKRVGTDTRMPFYFYFFILLEFVVNILFLFLGLTASAKIKN